MFDWEKIGGDSWESVPQHIWHDEESHMAAADVDLIKMADSAVARGHGDVFELDVHVVFGYSEDGVSFAASCRPLPQLGNSLDTEVKRSLLA